VKVYITVEEARKLEKSANTETKILVLQVFISKSLKALFAVDEKLRKKQIKIRGTIPVPKETKPHESDVSAG